MHTIHVHEYEHELFIHLHDVDDVSVLEIDISFSSRFLWTNKCTANEDFNRKNVLQIH